ncbi:sensor domain-containing protein [Pararhodospirillum oryzae]|uniref:Diguanylate cyclase n=1 Tax=Pararhodospirillum oryzae TaxID=478448 RepID=A0A512H439_9PROT|nr:EAL domain-containing protein [Pararhodospirillum oryzae]GEO80201.1 diguanylate cyclase [Pararhodospirillum oryzae]
MIVPDFFPSATVMSLIGVGSALAVGLGVGWWRGGGRRGGGVSTALTAPDSLVHALCDGLVVVDSQGRMTDLSPGAVALLGVDPELLRDQPVALVIPALAGGWPVPAALPQHQEHGADPLVLHGVRGDGRRVALEVRIVDLEAGGPGAGSVLCLKDASAQVLCQGLADLTVALETGLDQPLGAAGLAQTLCERVVALLECPLAWVGVMDHEGALRVAGKAGGAAPDLPEIPETVAAAAPLEGASRVPATTSCRMGRPVHLLVEEGPEWARATGIADLVCVPLWRQRDVMGMLCLGWASPVGLTSEVSAALEALALRLGATLARLRERDHQHLRDLAIGAVVNAIFVSDGEGRIEWVNEAFVQLSGYRAEELIGRVPAVLQPGTTDAVELEQVWAAVRAGRVWRSEMTERRKDGRTYVVNQSLTPVLDEAGGVRHLVAVQEDVTARKRTEERIRQLVNYDSLTRLPNRVLFRDRLDQAVHHARRAGQGLAVLFIDLDHFSRINDTLGHAVGDLFLMTIASRINAAAEKADTVARIGGDEFALIQLGVAGPDGASAVARHMLEVIRTPVDLGNHEVRVGANMGIAIYPQDGTDPDTLIRNADMALYRAKRSENEHCLFFSHEMNAEAAARLSLEGDLRRALAQGDQLAVHFQVQYDVRTARPSGAEALVRWTHPTLGPIPASTIIAVAEDSDLIHELGDWVLRSALAHYAHWRQRGCPRLLIAVNLSAVQFRNRGLVERVLSVLREYGVPPEDLELELTESMLMQDVTQAIVLLEAISRAGIRLAIDDFGTGYSSLSYLKRFRVDRLKVDQSFVHNLGKEGNDSDNDAVIARAVINLGHSLGLEVIAEGVETQAQYEYLRAQGCDSVQGFLFARPEPADTVLGNLVPRASGDAGPA